MSDALVYTFIVEWFDRVADLVKTLRFSYYTNHCIQITEEPSGRLFLKKMEYLEVDLDDLYLGNTIVVHGRQLNIVDYGDSATQRHMEQYRGRAFVLVTPEGVPQLGAVLRELRGAGFLMNQARMVRLTRAQATRDFGDASLAAGPVVGVELVDNGPGNALATSQAAAGEICGKLGPVVLPAADGEQSRARAAKFFGDGSAYRGTARMRGCTLCLVKPTAVRDGAAGDIVAAIQEEGSFEVTALRLLHLDADTVDAFFQAYRGVIPVYSEVVRELSSGALLAIELCGEGDVVTRFREFCGPVDTQVATVLRPGTLRARFGVSQVCNAVHCTDLPEDGVLECQYVFDQLQEI